jgi:hypothetical protein
MDVLENILEHIAACQEQRDVYLKQAEAEEQRIAKLESMYYLLEDPTTQELMKDVVVGVAVQNGAAVPNGNCGGSGEKHYVGMQRVREYLKGCQGGRNFRCPRPVHHERRPPGPRRREVPAPGI